MQEYLILLCLFPCLYLIYTDAKDYILPNPITLYLIISGFFYSYWYGNLKNSLIAFAIIALVFTLAYLQGGIGGGDLKMAVGIASWFGYPNALLIIILGCAGGILYGFCIERKQAITIFKNFFRKIYLKLLGVKNITIMRTIPEDTKKTPGIVPYGVFLGLASIIFVAIKTEILPLKIIVGLLFIAGCGIAWKGYEKSFKTA